MFRSRFLRPVVAACLVSLVVPTLAQAQQPGVTAVPSEKQKQAEATASKAFEAYQKGDFTNALTLYLQAQQVVPTAAILYNIATIYDKKLPDPQLAIDFYRKYISASDADPELSVKATARIQALNMEIQQKGTKPSEPAKPAEPPKPVPAKEEGSSTSKTVGWVMGGVGIVGLGLGLGFGASASSKLSTAKETCNGNKCTSQAGVDAMKSASGAATASTVFVIVGGVLTAAGITLVLTAPSSSEKPPVAQVRIGPSVDPTTAGVAMSGWFF